MVKQELRTIPTYRWLINYYQINGSSCRVFVLAEPVATVCPLITFRYVKNKEDEFFLAFGVRVFLFHIILFTTFNQRQTILLSLFESKLD